MSYNSSLTANSYQGLGLNDTLTGILAAQQKKQVLASVDYSNFSNFVFFNAAERKVQVALEYIFDNWPAGRTDDFYGTADFQLDQGVSNAIDDFSVSATDYEHYLLKKLGDPTGSGQLTMTATLTANTNQSISAIRTVINIPRDENKLLTDSNQVTFVSNLLDDAILYDAGKNSISAQGGTASIAGLGTQVFPTTTADRVNREHQLENMLPSFFFRNDDTNVLTRYVSVIAEVLDNLKVYIDQFASLRLIEYNKPNVPAGITQAALAELLGFEIINKDLRQDIEKQLVRASLTGDTSINSVIDQLQERILNNLIYILKTKGTKQSIEALIKSYGLPESFLDVREYAYQSVARPINYDYQNDYYLLDYTNNSVCGDRLALFNEGPEPFYMGPWDSTTIETRIKIPSLPTTSWTCNVTPPPVIGGGAAITSCTSSPASSTFFSILDPVAPNKIKLFYTSGQLCADYTKEEITESVTGTIKVSTPISLSGKLTRALSTEYVNVILRITPTALDLNAYYSDIIKGKKTITSITSSISNNLSGNSEPVQFGGQSTAIFGGEINEFQAQPRAEDIMNLFNGEMQEVRIWNTYLHNDDLESHARSFESITTERTDAFNRSNLTSTQIGLSNPYDNLWCHFKLRENIQQDSRGPGVNSANQLLNLSAGALTVIGLSASQNLYSKKTLYQKISAGNNNGLLFNILRSSVSGEYSLEDIKDSRLISVVADPMEIVNQNILNVYNQLQLGNLYGTATALYDNFIYDNASPYIQNWYQNWPASTVGNSLLFDGIINYQKALENLQDIFYSILLTARQLIPARSHLFEEGLLVKPHLLNRSRQERMKDNITNVDVLGKASTSQESITAAQGGLLQSGIFYNNSPSTYFTDERNYSLTRPNVTALTKGPSEARAFRNNFQTMTYPIEFFPAYPDKTEVDTVFDRVLVSPTGSNSIVSCSLKFLSNEKRIKTTQKAVRIVFPTFTDQTVGMLGSSKLIVTVDDTILPRSLTEYEFPISNVDGVSLLFRPVPEFMTEIMVPQPSDQPVPTFDINIIFINLITQKKTSQLLSYSLAY